MITVKDIREKEFSKQKHGYHEDEVDDFLDEIADQMEALIRENRGLMTQVEELGARGAAAPAYAPVGEAPVSGGSIQPPVDEPSYFRNLEATLRETLLSAQRIADNTVAEARVKAKDLVSGAEDQARKITDDANLSAHAAKVEFESLKKAHEEFKARFRRLVKDQMDVIDIDDGKSETKE